MIARSKVETFQNLRELLIHSATFFPRNDALGIDGHYITYKELKDNSEKLASYLQSQGVQKGVNVAIISENKPEWGVGFFSIMNTGGTAVCIDPVLSKKDIEFILKHSESTYLLSSSAFVPMAKNISESIPNLKGIVDIDEIDSLPSSKYIPPEISPDDPAILIYTSGTMGSKKGVLLSHRNIISNLTGAFERVPYKPKTNFLSLLPLSHMFGITIGFLGPLCNGGRITYPRSLKGYEIIHSMQTTKTEVMAVVPIILKIFNNTINEQIENLSPLMRKIFQINLTLAKRLNKIGINAGRILFRKIHTTFGGRIRYFISGGAPLSPEIEDFFSTIGIPVLNGYGLTETSPVISVNTLKQSEKGSVGRPLPQVEVNLAKNGEILVKGPNIMKGYYKNEVATKKVLKNGWFYTKDIGEIDNNGFLYIKGRAKNVIVTSSGLKVFSEEIETQLLKSSYIKEICILGRKVGNGEQPYAVIYPNYTLLKGMGKEDVYRKIKEEMEKYQKDSALYKKVQSFEIWDKELPKTTTRKIQRKTIRDIVEGEKKIESPETFKDMDPFASQIRSIIAKIADINESSIRWNSNLSGDLGIDSLMKVELLCGINKNLGVYIPEEYSYEIETFEDLVVYTRKYRDTPGAANTDLVFTGTKGNINELIKENSFLKCTRFITTLVLFYLSKLYFKLKVKHKERVPEEGSFIVSGNHTSLLDFPLIYISLPMHRMRDVAAPAAKNYFFTNPLKGMIVQLAFNAFPLERFGNFFEGLKASARVIEAGKPVVLFPEGTRSVKGTLQPFKLGIGLLSFELGVPILPVYIKGAYEAFPKGGKFPLPRPVEIRFGKIIKPEDYNKFKDKILNYQIYQKITDDLKEKIVKLMEEE